MKKSENGDIRNGIANRLHSADETTPMKKVAVIGSIATDFVVTAEAIPGQGETVVGQSLEIFCGGKGANQAIALSRSGLEVFMIGAVGRDYFGRQAVDNLAVNGIPMHGIRMVGSRATGSALIQVTGGDNRIVAVPGTNGLVFPEVVERHREELLGMDLVVLQNEIPLETVRYVIDFCRRHGVRTLYNPAPAKENSEECIGRATYLVLNEHEAAAAFGGESPSAALKKYPDRMVVTLGAQGSVFHDGKKEVPVPAFTAPAVVDTTGAGDAFVGYFAQGLLEGLGFTESIRRGNAAAALAVRIKGAQGGIPERCAVENFLREKEPVPWKS